MQSNFFYDLNKWTQKYIFAAAECININFYFISSIKDKTNHKKLLLLLLKVEN